MILMFNAMILSFCLFIFGKGHYIVKVQIHGFPVLICIVSGALLDHTDDVVFYFDPVIHAVAHIETVIHDTFHHAPGLGEGNLFRTNCQYSLPGQFFRVREGNALIPLHKDPVAFRRGRNKMS